METSCVAWNKYSTTPESNYSIWSKQTPRIFQMEWLKCYVRFESGIASHSLFPACFRLCTCPALTMDTIHFSSYYLKPNACFDLNENCEISSEIFQAMLI